MGRASQEEAEEEAPLPSPFSLAAVAVQVSSASAWQQDAASHPDVSAPLDWPFPHLRVCARARATLRPQQLGERQRRAADPAWARCSRSGVSSPCRRSHHRRRRCSRVPIETLLSMSAEGEMGSRDEKGAPALPRVRQTIPFRKPAIVADPPTSSSSRSDAHVSSSSAANQFLFSRQFHRRKQAVVVRSDARRRCASSSSRAHGRVRDRRRALDGLLHRLRLWRLMLPRLLLLLLNRHGTRHRFRSARSRRPSRSVHRRRSRRLRCRRSRRLLLRRLWLGLRLRNPSDGRSALHFGGKGGGDSSGRFTFRCRRGRGTCAFEGWRRRSGGAVGHVGGRGRHGGEVVALGFVHRVPVQFRLRLTRNTGVRQVS